VGSEVIHKHQTKLPILGRNKHSSLLQKFVNYGRKKFYDSGTLLHLVYVVKEVMFLTDVAHEGRLVRKLLVAQAGAKVIKTVFTSSLTLRTIKLGVDF